METIQVIVHSKQTQKNIIKFRNEFPVLLFQSAPPCLPNFYGAKSKIHALNG